MLKHKSLTSPRILWTAPLCLHDTSSGAAIQVKIMFEQFAKHGVHCGVLGAFNFDAASGGTILGNVADKMAAKQWANFDERGVSYSYLKTKSRNIKEMTREEEIEFFITYLHTLENFKPDIIFLFDLSPLEMAIMTEAKKHGISVVVIISNGNYIDFDFFNVDMILTDSKATMKLYHDKSRINILPTGTFIYPESVLAAQRDPQYITFINPGPNKGISIILRLALMAKQKHPHWKFLIVESRQTFEQALKIYAQDAKNFDNIEVQPHTTDIRTVYAKTKVLLVPSLWFECFGRVVVEANMNAIPVIASTSGGLPDAANGGGIIVNTPQKCRNDYHYFPSEHEVSEWFQSLETILDDKNYEQWSQKALGACKIHDIETSTKRTLNYLAPLFAKKPCFNAHFFKGQLNPKP